MGKEENCSKKIGIIAIIFLLLMLIEYGALDALKTKNTIKEKGIGMFTTETSYDMLNGGKFNGLKYYGYQAEVINTEYLSDSIAEIFMAYAIWGDGNYNISIYENELIGDTYRKLLCKWSFNENQKTGVVSFHVKQKQKIKLFFEIEIISDLPSSFSGPFTISTLN